MNFSDLKRSSEYRPSSSDHPRSLVKTHYALVEKTSGKIVVSIREADLCTRSEDLGVLKAVDKMLLYISVNAFRRSSLVVVVAIGVDIAENGPSKNGGGGDAGLPPRKFAPP